MSAGAQAGASVVLVVVVAGGVVEEEEEVVVVVVGAVDVEVVAAGAVVLLVGGAAVVVVDVVVVVTGMVVVVGPSKVARYVVSAAGVLMVWTCTPPSDQPAKVYERCGDGAPMVRTTPTTPVTSRGVVTGCPSSVS